MPVYIVTGKLGNGKTLVSVARIKDYLDRGRRVATNLDLRLHEMFGKSSRNLDVIRVPDKPKILDLEAIGKGTDSYDESKNGLLVLDECGTWFNARNWSDKDRKEVNEWFLHARKLGWDVILIVQDVSILDSQARAAIAELTAFCKRLDRISIPYVGALFKLLSGGRMPMPRIHTAKVVYGTAPTDLVFDRWTYRGTGLFRAYDTKQAFRDSYEHGTHCLLTPWHVYGRYQLPMTWERAMRITKIHWKRFKAPAMLGAGAFAGSIVSLLAWPFLVASMELRAQMTDELITERSVTNAVSNGVSNVDGLPFVPVDEIEFDGESAAKEVVRWEDLTVPEQFRGYRIKAHVKNQSSQYYLIADEQGSTFTDTQLRSMGYRVFYVSECEVMVTSGEDVTDKAHVFAPACSPRVPGPDRVDLAKMPAFSVNRW